MDLDTSNSPSFGKCRGGSIGCELDALKNSKATMVMGRITLYVKSIVFPFECEKVFVSLRCPKNSLA